MIQLLGLELRATARSAVPSALVRRVLVAGLAVIGVALCVIAVAAPSTGAPTTLARLGGTVLGTVGAGFGAALLACGAIALQPERARLARLAPLGYGMPLVARVAPTVLLTLGPVALFVLPIVIGLIRIDAGAAVGALIGLVLAGACAVGAAFLVAALSIRGFGAARAGPLLRGAGGAIFILILSQYPAVVSVRIPRLDLLALAAAGAVIAPTLCLVGARAFAASLGESLAARSVSAPVWGVAPFARLAWRSSVVPTLAIAIIAGFAAAWLDTPMRWAVGAFLVVMCASLPTGAALQAEDDRQERWRLAPSARRAWLDLLRYVALPAFAVSVALAVVLGWGHWNWVVAAVALAFSAAFAAAIVNQRVRLATLVPLLVAALATQPLG